MIVSRGGKYAVYSEDGKKKLSRWYSTREEAVKRLQQIEYFKRNEVDFTPPKDVQLAYKRGIKLYEQGYAGDGLEAGTVAKARQIAKGESVSPEWARKANRFWGRNKRFLKMDKKSPAYTSAMLWGGSPGMRWYAKLVKQMDNLKTNKEAPKTTKKNVTRRGKRATEGKQKRIYLDASGLFNLW